MVIIEREFGSLDTNSIQILIKWYFQMYVIVALPQVNA